LAARLQNCSLIHDLHDLFLLIRRNGGGPTLAFDFLFFIPTAAAPLFPGFGRGVRYKSQLLELLILSLARLLYGDGTQNQCRPRKSPSFENRKEPALSEVEGMGQSFPFLLQKTTRGQGWASPREWVLE